MSERVRFLEEFLSENSKELEEILRIISEIQEPTEPVYWIMSIVCNED